jgi:hypothetical protein
MSMLELPVPGNSIAVEVGARLTASQVSAGLEQHVIHLRNQAIASETYRNRRSNGILGGA